MAGIQDPQVVYQELEQEWTGVLQRLNRRKNRIGWGRLASAVAAIALPIWLWPQGWWIVLLAAAACLAVFLRLLVLDVQTTAALDNATRLLQINRSEISILQHRFTQFPDGSRLMPAGHPYAADLDIFGRSSLYQLLNRTSSEQGNETLARWLLAPSPVSELVLRQQAVQELSLLTRWRQQWQAYGQTEGITRSTEQKLLQWIQAPIHFTGKPAWRILRVAVPLILFSLLALNITAILPAAIFWGVTFLFFILTGAFSRKITPLYDQLNKVAPETGTLYLSMKWIESQAFESPLLQQLQQACQHNHGQASAAIRELKAILDRFDLRLNPLVFFFLNTFLFWDLHQVLLLEQWKTRHRPQVQQWFHTLAEMEALCSLATLRFNNPTWCFPVFSSKPGTLITTALGHPLIEHRKRVCNDFSTGGTGQLSLITGSNMAGKSTFLRSAGINIVLAMMGAPVCASSFELYPVQACSSMRISDNLEESTSTFYAELKKLKYIIDAVNRGETIFILLDEILRGTNSADRHAGSKALIRQLLLHKATGMIATHDLELAKMADAFPGQLHNYHFDVQVAGDELYFDYKLKAGVCHSMNASLLMKKIGIEM